MEVQPEVVQPTAQETKSLTPAPPPHHFPLEGAWQLALEPRMPLDTPRRHLSWGSLLPSHHTPEPQHGTPAPAQTLTGTLGATSSSSTPLFCDPPSPKLCVLLAHCLQGAFPDWPYSMLMEPTLVLCGFGLYPVKDPVSH